MGTLDAKLETDMSRESHRAPATGIYVRAWRMSTMAFDSVDIGELSRASLIEWLRSQPDRAEQTVLAILHHSR